MVEIRKTDFDVEQLAEDHYVEAPANLPGCQCADEHRLHVALSEQRGRPAIFSPDHKALKNAYCETYGRRCKA
jgi:hypothetical protein